MSDSLKSVRDSLIKDHKSGSHKNIRCQECNMRVRGANHEKGEHHIKKAPKPTE